MTVLTHNCADQPGKQELRLMSNDVGITWVYIDTDPATGKHEYVKLDADLLPQVEIVGSTPTTIIGRIVFNP